MQTYAAMLRNTRRLQWLLIVVIALIIVGPYLVLQKSIAASQEAARWVLHSQQVEATAANLGYRIRDLEAAALSDAARPDPLFKTRLRESMAAIPGLQRQLQALTQDNPRQQANLAELDLAIQQRVAIASQAAPAGREVAQRVAAIAQANNRYLVRQVLTRIIDGERVLLHARQAEAARSEQRIRLLGAGFTVLQLALLTLMTVLIQRQQQQRLAAELEQRNASSRAEAIIQTIRDPIALVDDQQRVMMHNTAFGELYAARGQGISGQTLADLANGAWGRPDLLLRLRDVVSRNRELWDFELPQTTMDGVKRTMLLNARPMLLPDQHTQVALLTVSDITAQKAAERNIQELNQQLAGKVAQVTDVNRELEAFSYSVSHDLRAPLRHISGFTDKLRRHLGPAVDDKAGHYLGIIDASTKRMAALIDDLLVYSRLGRSALRLHPVDMQSLVMEVRAMLDAAVDEDASRQRIDWHIAPLPIVVADDNMMRQVWQNLLGNAVKYSGTREVSRIEVGYARTDDGDHVFSVRDNGVGFDMAYAGKLFGVFQRMHKASEFPGTGIGLASVKRVLLRHGGTITAESVPGEGSTFRFTLPAMLDNAPALQGTSA